MLQVQALTRPAGGADGSAEAPPAAAKLRRSVERLSRLVEELLDVSRLAAGRLPFEPEGVDFDAVCREVAERLGPEAERQGSQIEVRSAGPLPGRCDPGRLDQVIQNLLSNAIKYGNGRPIELEVGGDSESVRVVVRDHGIGIAAEDQPRIFQRFGRAVAGTHFGGFGLGLWISHQIVETAGGEIFVESSPGAGSTFTVSLPRFGNAASET